VEASNAAARAAGAEVGMTKTQIEACPAVVVRWRSAADEASAQAAVFDCAWAISPRVEGGDEKLPGTVVLDLAGCERLFGSPEKIASDLKRVAAQVGFDANVAIAGNPEAAISAARGFAGITIIPEGAESARLGGLPLSSLPIPPRLLETLHRWGIHTCADFVSLPETALVERLGQEGRRWQLLARGEDPKPLLPKEPPIDFEECMDLEFSVELLEPLMFVLNRLLHQLCTRLSMHVLAASEVRLTLTLEKGRSHGKGPVLHVRTLRLPVPARESTFLLKLLRLDLQNHPPGAPVVAVKVSAVPARSRTRQMGLFLPLNPEPERLEVTLARIRNTVGADRVGSPVLLDTHRPNAFQQQHFVVLEMTTEARPPSQEATAALRIFRPPLLASVKVEGGKPAHIACDGAQREVLALAGPWRSKGDWWSETVWARDEWDVLLETLRPKYQLHPNNGREEETALYRIYRNLRSRRWYVEGIYD
jgi:protein ImuB